jgi:nucleoside-diphosphate-sugar epimerase
MEKILITGSTGFIGTNLIRKLKSNFKIIGISNKSKIKGNHIKKDITKISTKNIPRGITTIIHLAAIADVNYCDLHPEKCFKTNVIGTEKILRIARDIGAKVIFVSTSHVYGKPQSNPVKEKHTTNPNSMYSISKIMGEELCKKYSELFNMDISIARIFSVYGPNSQKYLVINKIIKKSIESEKIELGNIFPRRDFIYIDDVVNAIEKILFATKGFKIFNVGTGKSLSISNVCKIIEKNIDKKIMIEKSETLIRNNEISNIFADIHKLKQTGWKQENSMEEGILKTITWFNKQKKAVISKKGSI